MLKAFLVKASVALYNCQKLWWLSTDTPLRRVSVILVGNNYDFSLCDSYITAYQLSKDVAVISHLSAEVLYSLRGDNLPPPRRDEITSAEERFFSLCPSGEKPLLISRTIAVVPKIYAVFFGLEMLLRYFRTPIYITIMAIIKSVRGFTPEIGENCYLADNAAVIGAVVMGRDCSIWFGAVLRGDVNSIRIGNGVNIQDGSVLHTLYQKSTIEIGDNVSVGHNVTIHGAAVKDNALIGMGSTLLDHVVVGEGAIVAAGAVVTSGTVVGPNELWAGVPAKFVKKVDPEQSRELNQRIARQYLMYASWYKEEND